jgi:hypothetical protein
MREEVMATAKHPEIRVVAKFDFTVELVAQGRRDCNRKEIFSDIYAYERESPWRGKKTGGKQGKWIQLFNGKDLTSWTPKFVDSIEVRLLMGLC